MAVELGRFGSRHRGRLGTPLVHVRVHVEVEKEERDYHAIGQVRNGKSFGECAVRPENVNDRVSHDGEKLNELKLRQVLLPAQILLHVRSECGQHVVGVHDRVNERVEHAQEERLSAAYVLEAQPGVREHGRVVKHVKECDLVVFFPKREENLKITKANFKINLVDLDLS